MEHNLTSYGHESSGVQVCSKHCEAKFDDFIRKNNATLSKQPYTTFAQLRYGFLETEIQMKLPNCVFREIRSFSPERNVHYKELITA